MSATETAAQVLAWAAEPEGAPPRGPLWEVTALARPPAAATDAAVQLARRTAARLGAGTPPFGSRNRIGLGAVFLAAAIGGRGQERPASLLAQAIEPGAPNRDETVWYDLIARHGLVSAAVTALGGPGPAGGPGGTLSGAPAGTQPEPGPSGPSGPQGAGGSGPQGAGGSGPQGAGGSGQEGAGPGGQPLAELLLDASPLTAVLYRPSLRALKSDTTRQPVNVALALLRRPQGRAVLAAGLAGWSPLTPVLSWRVSLLGRLRLDHQDLLLDVYFLARTRFAGRWDERIAWARRQLGTRGTPPDPLAIATLRFWAPLAQLERASPVPLAALRPLMTGHERALQAVRSLRLDQTGAA